MSYDGTLKFDTEIDSKSFERDMEKLELIAKNAMDGGAVLKAIKELSGAGNDFFDAVKNITGAQLDMKEVIEAVTGQLTAQAAATAGVTVAQQALNGALAFGVDLLAGFVLGQMSEVIDRLVNGSEEFQRLTEDARHATESIAEIDDAGGLCDDFGGFVDMKRPLTEDARGLWSEINIAA